MGLTSSLHEMSAEEAAYEDIVEAGRLDNGNLFFGTSLFAGWDEDEVLGLPPSPGPLKTPTSPGDEALSVRSCVNFRKESVKFLPSEDGKTGVFHFLFDTMEPCTVQLKFKSPNEDCTLDPRAYSSGLGQICQLPFNLRELQFQREEEGEEGETDDKPRLGAEFSIVLKAKGTPGAGTQETSGYDIRKQITSFSINQLVLEDETTVFDVKLLQQVVSHNGNSYVIHDIFGLENTTKETDCCVICLAEEKNTICIPCRHLCVCQDCAQVLKFQSNKCPICRTPVRAMLNVKFSKDKQDTNIAMDSDEETSLSSTEEELTRKGSVVVNVEESF
eukprot:TRINITY_DN15472_c0_g1_i1.p1 TRINITY_DN15472_c0_g1~~TRINITY_DN15472_c0_g1_i1.p1  ORF type:complete len:331 (-),score=61.24 TRINITY_DN15472_c0_g1_i1:190-1182(-)